jgi:hypothetical protein
VGSLADDEGTASSDEWALARPPELALVATDARPAEPSESTSNAIAVSSLTTTARTVWSASTVTPRCKTLDDAAPRSFTSAAGGSNDCHTPVMPVNASAAVAAIRTSACIRSLQMVLLTTLDKTHGAQVVFRIERLQFRKTVREAPAAA